MNTETPPLSNHAIAIGLYKYGSLCPSSDSFHEFHELVCELYSDCGIAVTYIGAEGPGRSGKFQRAGGRSHKKLVNARFTGIIDLSLASNPAGSDSPAYDSFAKCSLGFCDTTGECLVVVTLNEALLPFAGSAYEALLNRLTSFRSWDFGFGFHAPEKSKPDFYILGLDTGKLSPEEYKSLCIWYATRPEQRVRRLRGVHPYNIVNSAQLAQPVGDGTLHQFAERNGSLQPLQQEGLFLWRVEQSALPAICDRLAGTEAVVHGAAYNLSE